MDENEDIILGNITTPSKVLSVLSTSNERIDFDITKGKWIVELNRYFYRKGDENTSISLYKTKIKDDYNGNILV